MRHTGNNHLLQVILIYLSDFMTPYPLFHSARGLNYYCKLLKDGTIIKKRTVEVFIQKLEKQDYFIH